MLVLVPTLLAFLVCSSCQQEDCSSVRVEDANGLMRDGDFDLLI
jgi:hypothetical protein